MPLDPADPALVGRFRRLLAANGATLGRRARREILGHGAAAVGPLLALALDRELACEDSLGEGHVPIHAAKLLGQLADPRAVAPLIDLLADLDALEILYSSVERALERHGAPLVEPALAAWAASAPGDGIRSALVGPLSACGVRDDRVLAVLVAHLDQDPELAVGALAAYGDPAALPAIYQALGRWLAKGSPAPLGVGGVGEFLHAIEALDGEVPDRLADAVARQDAPRQMLRRAMGLDPDG